MASTNIGSSPALTFELVARCSTTRARASILTLPHGPVQLPIFMPVATQASLKGLTPEQLEETSCRLCLNNTYHLGLKPGQDVLDAIGGAHKLQGWKHNILTDSGGTAMGRKLTASSFQMSPEAGENHRRGLPTTARQCFSPRALDVAAELDWQRHYDAAGRRSSHHIPDAARMREAMERSVRWLDRCIAAHKNPTTQNLFCIIQGGLDLPMRRECTREMLARDTPGIAIGGLSGGEAKADYCRVVETCTELLPDLKPRYVMGIGYPEDLVVSVALGADMFDCVWPTRTARFGNAITKNGVINVRNWRYENDFGPIEEGCGCLCCRKGEGGLGVTRAFINHNAGKETVAAHLLSIHNVWYQLNLMKEIRQAVIEDRFPALIRQFFGDLYDDKSKYPEWAVESLKRVGVDLINE
ncbi:LOW QUALITY PROTEIN: queuine tRNA-ribosyltransferase [Colletotrichum tofieldiae]|nr:LOW QUALITY PROTEIN: queuine tRNA-ribosyltransferase [Colletotrichum tofieldiae]